MKITNQYYSAINIKNDKESRSFFFLYATLYYISCFFLMLHHFDSLNQSHLVWVCNSFYMFWIHFPNFFLAFLQCIRQKYQCVISFIAMSLSSFDITE